MKNGDIIKLKGLSKRGKDRINSHGNEFKVTHFGPKTVPPKVLVESLNNTWRGQKWMGWFIIGEEIEIIN